MNMRTDQEDVTEFAARLLQAISGALVEDGDDEALYRGVVDAAVAIMRSDCASMQMLYPERGAGGELRALAFHGFSEEAAQSWEWIGIDSDAVCAAVSRSGERVLTSDVEHFAVAAGTQALAIYLESGIRAVQTTPLFSRRGALLGMLSTHWRRPYEPPARDLQLLDILTRQAADLIELKRTQDALRQREHAVRDNEALLAGQAEALQAALDDAPLARSLGVLVRTAVAQLGSDTSAAFYLADQDGASLHHVVGMPDDYARAVDGFKIGPESLACGLATHRGSPVITPDVTKEPLWQPWLWLAERFDYRGCWSFPIRTSEGRHVGTFAVYSRHPRELTSRDAALVTVFTDSAAIIISRHTEAEERKRAEERLREEDRRKDEFLAILAHELRSPLAPIRTAAELLRRQTDGPSVRRLADVVVRQTGQMTRLIDDLLDVSRISRGTIQLHAALIDVRSVVTQAVEASQPEFQSADVELSVALPDKPIILYADRARLAQVIGNLLNNAAKFTERRGHVWLSVEREHEQVRIRVRDDGIGMAPEDTRRIFDMFVQVDSSLERTKGGLGVGLTLAQTLVELHSGRIEVRSGGSREGTEFTVYLPVMQGEAAPLAESVAASAQSNTRRRVLVVDDHLDSAETLAEFLVMNNHDVRVAHNGPEALRIVQEFAPEVVLLDIGLPGMNGYEVAERIRESPSGQQILLAAITGFGQPADRERTAQSGFDVHVVKPIDPDAIAQFVNAGRSS